MEKIMSRTLLYISPLIRYIYIYIYSKLKPMRCIGSSRGIGESFSGLLKTRPILIRGCTDGYAPMGYSLFSYLFTPFSDAAPQQRKRNVYMDMVRLKVHAPCPWDIKQSTTGLLQRLPQNKIPWIDGRSCIHRGSSHMHT